MSLILGLSRYISMRILKAVKKDDAVSPVIGVMLMIVITVVIGAVVALFATNVMSSTEAAPVAVLEAVINTEYTE